MSDIAPIYSAFPTANFGTSFDAAKEVVIKSQTGDAQKIAGNDKKNPYDLDLKILNQASANLLRAGDSDNCTGTYGCPTTNACSDTCNCTGTYGCN